MKYLVRGAESKKRIALFLEYTKIESESQIDGIYDYLNVGHPLGVAAGLNGISTSNLSRDLEKLDDKARIHERLKELDWPNYKSVK